MRSPVTEANITDRQGALDAIEQNKESWSVVVSVPVDGGYAGQPFAEAVRNLIVAAVQAAKRSE